jgi:transketolase
MRRKFALELHKHMLTNPKIVVIVADLGYGMFDKIKEDFPDRFYNVGAAEQAAMGICVGLALEGKIPILYTITPFLLYRAFETIRNYINHENIPVKLVGSGRDKDYENDGFSHWATEDEDIMRIFKNISTIYATSNDIEMVTELMLTKNKPFYLNLRR